MDRRAERETTTALAARYIELTGIVQGVGFRPFVYNLALAHGLRGWVRNTSSGVQIQAEGPPEALDGFVIELSSKAPPLARIVSLIVQDRAPNGYERFAIEASLPQPNAYQLVSPDIATCPDCLREILEPTDRRYGYPFTNCTNCGPRFTIIRDIPYDRSRTTMREFVMCPSCQAEYEDPTDRRFHAQPNACPVCGPHLTLVLRPAQTGPIDRRGSALESGTPPQRADDMASIAEAARLLREGKILALKGLGGFHLACDATNGAAVAELRARKMRPAKPFALMMASLEDIRSRCVVSEREQELLCSPSAPIVLLRRRPQTDIDAGVAPANLYLGVMLPYTPLHHLLLREVKRPLVMTSGNLSEEPICSDNEEALLRLGFLADAFLMHDRGIYAKYDDSVLFVPQEEPVQPIRRARGYAPHPVRLDHPLQTVLALGAELKNTFCVTRDRYAFVSQHIGDLENWETLEHLTATVSLYEKLFRFAPAAVACDLHPDYMATRYARERAEAGALPLFAVQHHFAHVASCLADNNWPVDGGRVIGVAMDGTGLGDDGRIWGGEFLLADYGSARRFGQLQYLPLPGGDSATRRPYRIALAYLLSLLGDVPDLPFVARVPAEETPLLRRMVEQGINTPLTSSCGRLFDAVSALLGVCLETSYEAQAAIELEMVAAHPGPGPIVPYDFDFDASGATTVLRLERLFAGLVSDVLRGAPIPGISLRFHWTLAQMVVQMCQRARSAAQVNTVALSGGCFQNRLLLQLCHNALRDQGFQVLVHRQVPANDGGISLGQAVIASSLYSGRSAGQ